MINFESTDSHDVTTDQYILEHRNEKQRNLYQFFEK